MTHSRKMQLGTGLLAAACFAAAGAVQEMRRTESDLAEVLPGRAFLVNYLWIRADKLKEEGRFYDAMQLAEMICRLQRRFPGVWSFHSWNMAWNISVATHTPEERWRWVHNGLTLLRDQGIPLNRNAISLYKDLGWIYLFKIGNYLDDMHWVYKRQVAAGMQDLLGAPPEGTTEEVVAAFRPVAEAPLDKDFDRQGRQVIQADRREEVLRDPAVRAYADRLAVAGVPLDQRLLGAYNTYSLDDAVAVVRVRPPELDGPQARAVFQAINDPQAAGPRGRLLAFVRAQVLWNVHRMDPGWMLKMMQRYGPLDWRLPQSLGLYWLTYGLEVTGDRGLEDIDALNTERNALNCLKELTWRGRLTIVDARPRGSGPDALALEPVAAESRMQLPSLVMYQLPDMRFVQHTHGEFERAIRMRTGGVKRRFKNNPFRTGHINYLVGAVQMLYASHRRAEAQHYLDYLYENYAPEGPEWRFRDVREFVFHQLRQEETPIRDLAENQIGASLLTAFVALARGDSRAYAESLQYAQAVHAVYSKDRNERMRLPAMGACVELVAGRLLLDPRAMGYNLSLTDRSNLYRSLPDELRGRLYPRVRRRVDADCQREGIDFAQAFPPPPASQQTPLEDQPPALMP